ncbi:MULTISPECIES: DUF3618 domain-containing protein [Amycolatopsis]|uniref:DUF3618 domain-containing protein n=1 Tax=Amycolatopsis viridis TaxID=185678 RepID=A0ABX0SWZ2_9PSEU|nr:MULTISPECIES: DUF3618 domain-containing protein [Amycolatopsis]NIH81150.1 hypothetical protein [Amycolatopsis viridis]NIH84183.1 hypothetical protein [Amycolatopsis granulosa]
MTAKRDTFPHDAEQARLDLELTRQELGETAEALAGKMKETAHRTQRIALGTGAGLGILVLVLVLVRRLTARR